MIQTDGKATIANKTEEMDELLEKVQTGLTTRILYDRKNGTVKLYSGVEGWEEYILILPDNVMDAYEHPMTYVEHPEKFFEKT